MSAAIPESVAKPWHCRPQVTSCCFASTWSARPSMRWHSPYQNKQVEENYQQAFSLNFSSQGGSYRGKGAQSSDQAKGGSEPYTGKGRSRSPRIIPLHITSGGQSKQTRAQSLLHVALSNYPQCSQGRCLWAAVH